MLSVGFKKGKATPCAFYHARMEIRATVHGDDFTLLGHEDDLDWFRGEILKKFEVGEKTWVEVD